nr:YbaB/EbfC family nucleoid-associated protein [bacterium]
MARGGGFPGGRPGMGGMGGINQQQLMRQMQKLQQDMMQKQEELAARTVEATAGGGAVTAVASGAKRITEIKIDPDALNPEDADMVQDMVVAAVNAALEKAEEMFDSEMGKLTGGALPRGLF